MNNSIGKFMTHVFGITATFIGTVIGAGFASGQEILQFFVKYHGRGFWGIIITILIMGIITEKIFLIGSHLKSDSYRDFLLYVIGPKFIYIADFFFFGFILILVGVMFAGCGALFQELNYSFWLGIALSAAMLLLVLFWDLDGLMIVNMIVIPLMFMMTIGIVVISIKNRQPQMLVPVKGYSWVLAAFQFSAYNIILALPVLLSIAKRYPKKLLLRVGGWMGSLSLGLMVVFIYCAIIFHFSQLSNATLPMAYLAKSGGQTFFMIYTLIIWGEMLTTLIANAYGLGKRLEAATGWPFRHNLCVIMVLGIIIAKVGFVKLIAHLYPIYGCLSMIVLLLIMVKPLPNFRE